MERSLGFTLIELLVVLVIISITISFAIASLNDAGESRKIMAVANQMEQWIKLTQQQAILEHKTLGIDVHKNHIEWLTISKDGTWQSISHHSFLKPRYWNTSIYIMNEYYQRSSNKVPVIIVNSEGEISPFKLSFNISGKQKRLMPKILQNAGSPVSNQITA